MGPDEFTISAANPAFKSERRSSGGYWVPYDKAVYREFADAEFLYPAAADCKLPDCMRADGQSTDGQGADRQSTDGACANRDNTHGSGAKCEASANDSGWFGGGSSQLVLSDWGTIPLRRRQ